jgi:hypothetical protein
LAVGLRRDVGGQRLGIVFDLEASAVIGGDPGSEEEGAGVAGVGT